MFGCSREVGADPGEVQELWANESSDTWREREISKGRGQLGLALDPGNREESFLLFLSTEDVVLES